MDKHTESSFFILSNANHVPPSWIRIVISARISEHSRLLPLCWLQTSCVAPSLVEFRSWSSRILAAFTRPFVSTPLIHQNTQSVERSVSRFDGITQDERSVQHLWKRMGYFYEVRKAVQFSLSARLNRMPSSSVACRCLQVGGGAETDELAEENKALEATMEESLRREGG